MEQAEALQDDVIPEETQEIESQDEVTETTEIETEEVEVTDPVYEDVEYEGNNYNLPPELKEALLRQSDYTKKSTEVADQRKALEQQQQQFQQAAEMQSRNMQGHAQLAALQNQLSQYNGMDWNTFTENDPQEAQKAFFQYQQLKDATSNLGQQLSQQESQALQQQQITLAKQMEQGKAELARDIPDWSPNMASTLSEYGLKSGLSQQEITGVTPAHVKLLRKAMLYDQSMEKATTKPEIEVKPVTKVRGKAKGKPNPENMTTKEWMTWRNKQVNSNR